MNGYELRLEMLRMAKDLMLNHFHVQKDHNTTEYFAYIEANKGDQKTIVSKKLIQPHFPTIEEIVKQADMFNDFVVKKE